MCEEFRYLDPTDYYTSHPTEIVRQIDLRYPAWNMAFSPSGSMFALSCNTGQIEIWDVLTMRRLVQLRPFEKCINTVSWSHDGRRLWMSAGLEKHIAALNVEASTMELIHDYLDGVWSVTCHPRNNDHCLVFAVASLSLFDISTKSALVSYKLPTSDADRSEGGRAKKISETWSAVTFSYDGSKVLCGTTKGWIHVFDTLSGTLLDSRRFGTAQLIGITCSERGAYVLITSSNVVRLCQASTLSVLREFSDRVTNLSWLTAGFSGRPVIAETNWDSAYVYAMSSSMIYVWDIDNADLVARLEKPHYNEVVQNSFLAAAWHPYRPVMIGITYYHMIVYGMRVPERWAAMDPRFTEIEKNVFYEEREDEFDLEGPEEAEDKLGPPPLKVAKLPIVWREDLDADVDVLTRDADDAQTAKTILSSPQLQFSESEVSAMREREEQWLKAITRRREHERTPSSVDLIEGAVTWSVRDRRFTEHSLLHKFS
jgi:COMPASS component SWD1